MFAFANVTSVGEGLAPPEKHPHLMNGSTKALPYQKSRSQSEHIEREAHIELRQQHIENPRRGFISTAKRTNPQRLSVGESWQRS